LNSDSVSNLEDSDSDSVDLNSDSEPEDSDAIKQYRISASVNCHDTTYDT